MSNIRIKDIATTAASTASDDFIAIDGATNGTRKLDIYNPTIGGNVTVSGKGLFADGTNSAPSISWSTATGDGFYYSGSNRTAFAASGTRSLSFAASGTIIGANSGLTQQIQMPSGGDITLAAGGTNQNITLTPSGTGSVTTPGILKTTNTTAATSTTSGALQVAGGVGIAGAVYADGQVLSGSGLSITGSSSTVLGIGFGNSPLAYGTALIRSQNDFRIVDDGLFNIQRLTTKILTISNPNNNVLIGTATDSSNGKLQLATHTTSAGGIGFGTEISLYRTNSGDLSLNNSAGDTLLRFRNQGTEIFRFETQSSSCYITSVPAASSIILRTNGSTTALTLDSSQNATFAGNVDSSSANYNIRSTAAGGNVFIKSNGGILNLNNTVGNGDIVLGYSTSLINFKGSLQLNNAYVATPQVTTGYVTIRDSTGTTYKVLVAA